jgi:hypothetical protein
LQKYKNGAKIVIDFKSITKHKGGAITFGQTCKKDTRGMEKRNPKCCPKLIYF